jgi:hypothetical protein
MILLHPFEYLPNNFDSKLKILCNNDMDMKWLWARYCRIIETVVGLLWSRGREKDNVTHLRKKISWRDKIERERECGPPLESYSFKASISSYKQRHITFLQRYWSRNCTFMEEKNHKVLFREVTCYLLEFSNSPCSGSLWLQIPAWYFCSALFIFAVLTIFSYVST